MVCGVSGRDTISTENRGGVGYEQGLYRHRFKIILRLSRVR